MIARRLLAVALAGAAFGAAACGDDDSSSDASTQAAAPAATETQPAATTDAPPPNLEPVKPISKDLSKKPKIPRPEGDAPPTLVKYDVVVGDGPEAKAGDTVSVQYVGVSWSTGKQFDASWDRNEEPFAFQLGGQQVIPGWDQGVAGMKVGGRRELIIPPDLAYGAQGSPPDIAPGETLVFVIDLQQVQ
jgi:peptidylprolyl isomerase